MKTTISKKIFVGIIFLILILGFIFTYIILYPQEKKEEKPEKIDDLSALGLKSLTGIYNFSEPVLKEVGDYICVYVEESDFNSISDGRPVLPVKLITYEFPFGTKILDIHYEYSKPQTISLSKKISFGSCSTLTAEDETIYNNDEMYPSGFVSYHKGGGLSNEEYKTFLSIRIYPITYNPVKDTIKFVETVTIDITYKEPDEPLLEDNQEYDLIIIAPSQFERPLKPLVKHKNDYGVKTQLVLLPDIYSENSKGRDEQEKIKYFIKSAVEDWGVKQILLVGGIKGQKTSVWNLPVRYSRVLVSPGKQEIPEPLFISDLYYADIYDSEGNFSSWDTNNNGLYGEWDGDQIDEMDLYPDVYLGRLPCRNKREVRIMVDKIIKYEKRSKNQDWFKNMVLISGDHWNDKGQINEGELIMEAAAELMPGFNHVKLYASQQKINSRVINKAINRGCGFAYFCGHGSSSMWGTHYPPDGTQWTGFYKPIHMNFLINRYKLPVVVVGGCNNGKYDITITDKVQKGIDEFGLRYFSPNPFKLGGFWSNGMYGNCWSWQLTSKKGGGSIATISNTGLGTHAMDDSDSNSINDYLEVLDGWLELRFFQLYSEENIDMLGQLHGGAITDYLHRFLGSNDEMDPKMVQQWQLMGDPSLKVGGY